MFGYIKPCAPELKVKEQEAYRAVYCGLCKELGRSYGQLSRMTLSYDFAFLSVLAMGVRGDAVEFRQEHCMVHPLKKRNICQPCVSLELSAAMAIILLYHKLQDNIADGDDAEKAACLLALPAAKAAYDKAAAKLPALAKLTEEQMAAQVALEKERCSSVDRAAEPTAKILEALLGSLSEDGTQQLVLKRIGYLLGRCIYLMDALDDLEEDIKKDNYNPFRYCEAQEGESPQEQAVSSLYLTIAELIRAYDLLEVQYFEGILSNVFELGLKQSVDHIKEKRMNTK